ncbi:MAG TPA: TauD/TfdA family dioxygenase [Rhizomicrobium sp.]|jgi:alpha-ketoglutarate-dependent taurine dioxygenase|nr:TauD/TfdA family dioxygenase [Rhizomicrobium sp.]
MANTPEITPLDASFGAVVRNVRLAALNDEEWSAIYRAWLEHALLIFPEQFLSKEEQVAFATRFGALEFANAAITNIKPDGSLLAEDDTGDIMKVLRGNMHWHADSTYMPVQAKGAVFSAEIVPDEGGETGWADMRAAYDALDGATRERIENLSAYHSLLYSQGKLGYLPSKTDGKFNGYGYHDGPVPLRPLVKVHPETGRRSLLVGRHAHAIPGMDAAESEALLEGLIDFACQAPRVYHHRWAPGETVVWDNRCLLHRAMPWNMSQRRLMWHNRIAGDPVSEAAVA